MMMLRWMTFMMMLVVWAMLMFNDDVGDWVNNVGDVGDDPVDADV